MGLFDFMKKKDDSGNSSGQSISGSITSQSFGRYSDCNKSNAQLDEWDLTVKLQKELKFKDSFRALLNYIGDPALKNLTYEEKEGIIHFQFQQGSKLVHGTSDGVQMVAESRIAAFEKPSLPVMRKLATLNYSLKYSWFSIHDNTFMIGTKALHADSSPTKLYYALREIAINADKQDDIIVDEFSSLQQTDSSCIVEIPTHEKEVKRKYLHQWIDETLKKAEELDPVKSNGLISYLLLTLNLRIDYLICPQGVLMDKIEKIQGIYSHKEKDYILKNKEIISAFKEIRQLPDEAIFKSLYNTISTFSIVSPANYKQVADFIFEEAKSRDFYLNNRNFDAIVVIYEYIAGYLFFNYGLSKPIHDLVNLFMHVMHNSFYQEMGLSVQYQDATGNLNKQKIVSAIQQILNENRKKYPLFSFRDSVLDFSSKYRFAMTFFAEFDFLKL
jgi:hypothetical protein